MQTGGRTEMMRLIVTFRYLVKASKMALLNAF
jgi:hypothetical protein